MTYRYRARPATDSTVMLAVSQPIPPKPSVVMVVCDNFMGEVWSQSV